MAMLATAQVVNSIGVMPHPIRLRVFAAGFAALPPESGCVCAMYRSRSSTSPPPERNSSVSPSTSSKYSCGYNNSISYSAGRSTLFGACNTGSECPLPRSYVVVSVHVSSRSRIVSHTHLPVGFDL